jgi:hypothetical protein
MAVKTVMDVNNRIYSNIYQKFIEILDLPALKIEVAGSFKIWYPTMKLAGLQPSTRLEQIALLQGLNQAAYKSG